MVGHQWFTRISDRTPPGPEAPGAKQEHEMSSRLLCTRSKGACPRLCAVVVLSALCVMLLVTCAAVSVLYNNHTNRKSEKLFNYQNISDGYSSLTNSNNKLKRNNEMLEEQNSRLHQQNKLVSAATAELRSLNLALSLKCSELTKDIVNLTSTNTQLTQEYELLVQYSSQQEAQMLNVSQAVDLLVRSNARLQEEKQRLSETSDLLRDQVVQVKGQNQELLEINEKFQAEIQNLTEMTAAFSKDDLEQLQEQNQNLSAVLLRERQEAAEKERSRAKEVEQMALDVQTAKEAYRSLDLLCPVVNEKTRERICKKCPNTWKQFESKCYYFSSDALDWRASKSWCRTQGGALLTINSEREQRFVFDSSRTPDPSGTRLWIGLSDEDEEGQWRWVDGSRVTSDVQYWLRRPGGGAEPDNWKLDDPLGEDCGHIDTSEKALESWMDGSCKIAYRWICEKNF